MIEIDDRDIRRAMQLLGKTLASSKTGKVVKRELSKKLRGLAQPLVEKRKSAVRKIRSKGHEGPSLRQAIAKQTKAATRWSGNSAGLSIAQKARGMPRGFDQAGRAFNRAEGWNPTSLGGEVHHQEVRPVEWFDSTNAADGPKVRQEVVEALEEVAGTLAGEIRRIH